MVMRASMTVAGSRCFCCYKTHSPTTCFHVAGLFAHGGAIVASSNCWQRKEVQMMERSRCCSRSSSLIWCTMETFAMQMPEDDRLRCWCKSGCCNGCYFAVQVHESMAA
ncbi:hypothetical protein DEO72_LG9g1207 [Vigna unguiculata]|uniref:Uncharacterized protein n=1 Tax=Vigna unguiculata TaxID=3917 RepID=A0A4D6MXN4_VIGUN|nr:hypothetical protein DEO72_LG9g1207 [Vigna unguiculata]